MSKQEAAVLRNRKEAVKAESPKPSSSGAVDSPAKKAAPISVAKKNSSLTATADQADSPVPFAHKLQPYLSEDFADVLYKPHTVTGLVIGLAMIVYFAFFRDYSAGLEANTKAGIVASMFIFLMFCLIQMRDSLLMRPHPAVWRVVTGMAILYLMVLVFFLFQTRDDARILLKYLYPDLGKPLPERNYADDCRIHTPEHSNPFKNIWDTFNDEFIVAHVLGYVGKALLVRDWKLLWAISILFELVEITFQHWLHNFKECWWDHIIIDILLCNFLGMFVGLKLTQYLKMKKYPLWIGLEKIPSTKGKLIRALEQLTPFNWTSYDWEIFASAKKFAYFVFILLGVMFVDTTAFFLKYILWVPSKNLLNTYRLILWFIIANPAIRELYQFVSDPDCKRLGPNAWLAAAIIVVEVLVVVKFCYGLFPEPWPNHIWLPWLAFFVIFGAWFLLHFFLFSRKTRETNRTVKATLNVLLTVSMVPLTFMFFAGCPDLQWGREWFDNLVDAFLKANNLL